MASVASESLEAPSGIRGDRVLVYEDHRSSDELAGRTVWCASALEGGRGLARALRACLEWVGEGSVAARDLQVAAGAPLRRLAERLDGMLHGMAPAGEALGAAERELATAGVGASERSVTEGVAPGDVVVLHDPLTALLAEAVRERGAHAVWYVEFGARREDALAGQARLFLREYTAAVDAYMMTWSGPRERGLRVQRIAALMPSAGLMAARDIRASPGPATERCRHVGWSSVLAEVAEGDRNETVGGRLHPRPTVAAR